LFVSFRTQALCNRVTCAINLVQDDVNDFIERSEEQLNHLPRNLRLTLLEQHAWANERDQFCLFCRSSEGFPEKPATDSLCTAQKLLRSRSERVRNAVGTRSERVPEETWKLVPNFGKKKTRSRKIPTPTD
jgi:hypothetical protein